MKIRILKNCICYHELVIFLISEDFYNEMDDDIMEYHCLILYNEMINNRNICIKQWTTIFQMTMFDTTKSCTNKKDPFKV